MPPRIESAVVKKDIAARTSLTSRKAMLETFVALPLMCETCYDFVAKHLCVSVLISLFIVTI